MERLIDEMLAAEHAAAAACHRAARAHDTVAVTEACVHVARTLWLLPILATDERWRPGTPWLAPDLAAARAWIAGLVLGEDGLRRWAVETLRRGEAPARALLEVAKASGRLDLASFCAAWLRDRAEVVAGILAAAPPRVARPRLSLVP